MWVSVFTTAAWYSPLLRSTVVDRAESSNSVSFPILSVIWPIWERYACIGRKRRNSSLSINWQTKEQCLHKIKFEKDCFSKQLRFLRPHYCTVLFHLAELGNRLLMASLPFFWKFHFPVWWRPLLFPFWSVIHLESFLLAVQAVKSLFCTLSMNLWVPWNIILSVHCLDLIFVRYNDMRASALSTPPIEVLYSFTICGRIISIRDFVFLFQRFTESWSPIPTTPPFHITSSGNPLKRRLEESIQSDRTSHENWLLIQNFDQIVRREIVITKWYMLS